MPHLRNKKAANTVGVFAGPVRLLVSVALALASVAAQAQAAPKPVDGPSLTPMLLALLVVLGLMGAAVWVLRRIGIAPRAGSSYLRLVTQLSVGPRERVVIVEAGDRWLLLGVGTGGISRLGTLPKAEAPAATAPPPSFGALLDKLRGGAR
jgi:flagellar protein FliO/FliZ